MTATDAADTTDDGTQVDGDADASSSPQPAVAGARDRLLARLAFGLTLAPFVVGALALLVAVGGQYNPLSDHALTELQTRSVGRDEVLVGLYSREVWNHPGPALFYVLAPFYWATGGMSVGISLGALAVNGGAVAGMGLVARRIGGTPLLLLTLLANALLMRTLGAEFLQDPWNCFVTTLPFGLLIFLSWAMWRGEAWALPVGVGVASFLAQSHVGFVALAPPVLGWGIVGLLGKAVLETDGETRSIAIRRAARAAAIGAGVLVVTWLPVLYDLVRYAPSNASEVVSYFRHSDDPAHSLPTGWRVMSGQFGGAPEWLTAKREFGFVGQSPFILEAPLPWMLVLVVLAGVVLWRRRVPGARPLLTTLAVAFAVGMVAVARTIGPAFDYRLRWTFIPGMVGFVVIGWAVWTLASERWPRLAPRVLAPMALAALTVLCGINVVTAATAGTPQNDDSAAVASLSEQVLDALPDDLDGPVLVEDAYYSGAWHARGLVLQLERRGIDVGVDRSLANEYGRHRVIDRDEEVGADLIVTRDEWIDQVADRPGLRPIAEWSAVPEDEVEVLVAEFERIEDDKEAGRLTFDEAIELQGDISRQLTNDGQSMAYRVVVFIDEGE
jgi:hypothetical protein